VPSGASFIWLRGRFDSPGASDFGRLLSFFVEFCALPFGRFACNLIWLLAGPKARFWLTQDFRPRLSSVAPAGLAHGSAVCVHLRVCSIDWSLRVERLETIVLG
jgi:hypothetical protein